MNEQISDIRAHLNDAADSAQALADMFWQMQLPEDAASLKANMADLADLYVDELTTFFDHLTQAFAAVTEVSRL